MSNKKQQKQSVWDELQAAARAQVPEAVDAMNLFNSYNARLGGALSRLKEQPQDIQGRDSILDLVLAVIERPITPVLMLLGLAGVGKTATIEALVKKSDAGAFTGVKNAHRYMVIALNVGILGALGPAKVQAVLSSLLDDLKTFEDAVQLATGDPSVRLILFIDEAHTLVTIFGAGTKIGGDVIKATFARPAIRVVAATTRREWDSTFAPDKPLSERFKIIELPELHRDQVVEVCYNWWDKVALGCPPLAPEILNAILDANAAYRPDSAEPRKSLDILEDLVSYSRRTGKAATIETVHDIFHDRYAISLSFSVDPAEVYGEIDRRIKGQAFAKWELRRVVNSMVFGVDPNPNKPIISALMSGPSGVGKGTTVDTKIPVWTKDGSTCFKDAGDIVVGDYVFSRLGKPERVVGVYPQGRKDVYKVTLGDGRTLTVDGAHLWGVYPNRHSREVGLTIYSTETLIKKGLTSTRCDGLTAMQYYIPMNQAVQWPEKNYRTDPYVVGAAIGDGCLTQSVFELSSQDEFIVAKIAQLIGATSYVKNLSNYSWVFGTGEKPKYGPGEARVQVKDIFSGLDEIVGKKSIDRSIPQDYMVGSIEQRWRLIQGLFDTDGSIGKRDAGRFGISYSTSSKQLAEDIQQLLYSLGVSSTIGAYQRDRRGYVESEYRIRVKTRNTEKWRFFSLPRKLKVADTAKSFAKTRYKSFDYVGIRSIKKLPSKQKTICFYVADDEHLYQAGDFIVTHNTETVKAIADTIYPHEDVLFFMNMPDFKTPEHDLTFRKTLGERLRHVPNSVVLFDEVEKAHPTVLDSLLSILDEGIVHYDLTNREGFIEVNEVSLRNSIIFATTNAGADVFADDARYSSREVRGGR